MRTKNIILIASLVLFVCVVSCKKDHEIPTGKVFNSEHGGDTITPIGGDTLAPGGDTIVPGGDTLAPSGDLGMLPGLFSIGSGSQIHFSQGNLQYQASTKKWRFATNQYDNIGSNNSNISQSYSGWIDLFGWGTSGYNHGAVCYQPWSTSTDEYSYKAYGSNVAHLWYQSGNADWGYNAISNGGNQEAQWRTLSKGEWEYIFTGRSTASGIRYARGKVNEIRGILLFPDDWNASLYTITNYNTSSGGSMWSSFEDNTISLSDWEQLEASGVVFLLLAGSRTGTEIDLSKGLYWSSSNWSYGTAAYCVSFDNSGLDPSNSNTGLAIKGKMFGLSVRLVCNAE